MTDTIHPIAPAPVRPSRIRLPRIFRGKPAAAIAEPRVEDLHFVEIGAFRKLVLALFRTVGGIPQVSPVALLGQTSSQIMPIALVGQAMGFRDERCQRLLRYHQDRRLRKW